MRRIMFLLSAPFLLLAAAISAQAATPIGPGAGCVGGYAGMCVAADAGKACGVTTIQPSGDFIQTWGTCQTRANRCGCFDAGGNPILPAPVVETGTPVLPACPYVPVGPQPLQSPSN